MAKTVVKEKSGVFKSGGDNGYRSKNCEGCGSYIGFKVHPATKFCDACKGKTKNKKRQSLRRGLLHSFQQIEEGEDNVKMICENQEQLNTKINAIRDYIEKRKS